MDWAWNVLVAGSAHLKVGDEEFDLTTPRMISKEAAWEQLPDSTKGPPERINPDYLQMDLAQ